jgi:hypothetical protein
MMESGWVMGRFLAKKSTSTMPPAKPCGNVAQITLKSP